MIFCVAVLVDMNKILYFVNIFVQRNVIVRNVGASSSIAIYILLPGHKTWQIIGLNNLTVRSLLHYLTSVINHPFMYRVAALCMVSCFNVLIEKKFSCQSQLHFAVIKYVICNMFRI